MAKSKSKNDLDKAQKLIEYAKKWLGVPYALKNGSVDSNGNPSKSVGIDCTRFVRRCYAHIKIKLPKGYPGPMYRATKGAKCKLSKNKKGLSKLQPGDLVFFISGGAKHGKKGHATMYIGDGKIIHSNTHPKNGVQIQKLFVGDGAYKGGGRKAYRVRVLDVGTGAVKKYLDEARKHLSKDGEKGRKWVKKTAPMFHEGAWCADTQCALAKATGFAGKIMPSKQYSASGFGRAVVEDYGGTYIKGPGYGGGSVTPRPGDLIELFGGGCSKTQPWSSGHIGVVEKVKKGIVHTIEGNTSNKYKRREYKKGANNILWYARPNWDKVGGAGYDDTGGGNDDDDSGPGGLLYDSLSTEADATLREVSYATENGEPSNDKKSSYKLCVANYTSVLFWMVYALGGTGSGDEDEDEDDGEYDLSAIKDKTAKKVVKYLLGKGLNPAVTVGIVANIWWESGGFKTSAISSDGANSIGLCQWTGGRADAMKEFVGDDWKTDLTGQLDYLWHELHDKEKAAFDAIKKLSNTKDNAIKATEIFCKKFERPSIPHMDKRKDYAKKLYPKIKLKKTSSGSWMVPVKASYMVNSYGEYGAVRSYEMHPGIDMASPLGTPIYAASDGKVILAQLYGGYGNCVRISHSDGLVSLYGHGSKILVKKDQKVSKGDKIMLMGSSGWSTGSHLHFQINKGTGTDYGSSINPRKYCKIHGIGTGK